MSHNNTILIFYKDLQTNSILPIIHYKKKIFPDYFLGLNEYNQEHNRKKNEENLLDFFRNKKYFNFEKSLNGNFFFRFANNNKIKVDYLTFDDLSISCTEVKDEFVTTESFFGIKSNYLEVDKRSGDRLYLIEKIFICGNIGITRFEEKGYLHGFSKKYVFNNYLHAFYKDEKRGSDNWKYTVYLWHTPTNTKIASNFSEIFIEWIDTSIIRVFVNNMTFYIDKIEGLLFSIRQLEIDMNITDWDGIEIVRDKKVVYKELHICLKNSEKELCHIYTKQDIQFFHDIMYVNTKFSFSLQYLLQPIINKKEPIEKFGLENEH
jgi:hypothetical protein